MPHFAYYLKRHIELDGEEHGPIAQAALANLAGRSNRAWRDAARAAKRALRARIELWDGVCRSYTAFDHGYRQAKHVPRVRFAEGTSPMAVGRARAAARAVPAAPTSGAESSRLQTSTPKAVDSTGSLDAVDAVLDSLNLPERCVRALRYENDNLRSQSGGGSGALPSRASR